MKIRPPVCAVGDDKKKRKGKVSHNLGLYFSYMGRGPLGPISTKIGKVKGAHDIIILPNFGLNIFRGFRSIGGQSLPSSH